VRVCARLFEKKKEKEKLKHFQEKKRREKKEKIKCQSLDISSSCVLFCLLIFDGLFTWPL
jgi:hypothetical protein